MAYQITIVLNIGLTHGQGFIHYSLRSIKDLLCKSKLANSSLTLKKGLGFESGTEEDMVEIKLLWNVDTETVLNQYCDNLNDFSAKIFDDLHQRWILMEYKVSLAGANIKDASIPLDYENKRAVHPSDLLSPVVSYITGLEIYTRDDQTSIVTYPSTFLRKKSYGTSTTTFSVVDSELLSAINDKLLSNRLLIIHGKSGRGKTFFVFSMIETCVNNYDYVLYYSPHFHGYSDNDKHAEQIIKIIQSIHFSNKRLLFILDDSHLVDEYFKNKLQSKVIELNKFSLLFVSRVREDVVPNYEGRELYENFDIVAEGLFDKILQLFCDQNKITINEALRSEIRSLTGGANLVFLTLLLQSWATLIGQEDHLPTIMQHAYSTFLRYYEANHSESWKYINHIVSGLFQYEIRIDKRFLDPTQNKHLANFDLTEYLQDRLIHRKRLEDEGNRLYYVFMDFAGGRGDDMMKHAAEFGFYLEAYSNNLTFGNLSNLSRIEFTKKLLEDYILFKPFNVYENVIQRIIKNAEPKESHEILVTLFSNDRVRATLDGDFSALNP
jgi:hypothetical protein